MSKVKKLLVIRNDKLGDLVQTLPAFAMLKQSAPDWRIIALVPEYTAELVFISPYIDNVIIDVGKNGSAAQKAQRLALVRQHQFDASINFFSNTDNALLVWRASIPQRFAPATKLAQLFYNHRVKQRRSQSLQPEFAYNLDLARAFLRENGLEPIEPQIPYLSFNKQYVELNEKVFRADLNLPEHAKMVFVHAGNGGTANNLPLTHYAFLIDAILAEFSDVYVVLTAGAGELDKALNLQNLCQNQARIRVYDSREGLAHFACVLASAAAFVASSTGTLHLAAALNRPVIGFYSIIGTATPLRWQPMNEADKRLIITPPDDTPSDLSRVDMAAQMPHILAFLARQFQAA